MPRPEDEDIQLLTEDAATPTGDLRTFFHLLLDKAWLIGACLMVGVIAAAFYLQRTPRVYEATTTVQVEQEEQKVVNVEKVLKEDLRGLEILNTIAQKLVNRPLLESVLEQNGLLESADQDGNPSKEELVLGFEKSVNTSLRRNTRLIDIKVRNRDPKLAARLANSIVEKYLTQDFAKESSTSKGASQFLREESARLQKKLEESERALQDYRQEAGTVSFEEQNNTVAPRLQDLNRQLTSVRADVVRLKANYDDVLNMGINVSELLAYSQISSDPAIVDIQMSIVRLESEFAMIRERYREKHPRYITAASSLQGLNAQLADAVIKLKRRLQDTARIPYENSLAVQRGLEKELKNTEAEALQLSEKAIKFNQLSREVESDRALFDSVLGRLKETSVTSELAPEKIRIIQVATPPLRPSYPRVRLVLALAILGSIVVGVGIAMLQNAWDSSLRSVDEAEQYLKLPVLGIIPKLSKKEMSAPLVAAGDSESPGAEIFRSLRATLSMMGRDKDRRTFILTSSFPDEGKTFTSVNYAASLAQQGLRTLIIDADLRRPAVEQFFTGNHDQLEGLTEFLLERATFESVVQRHPEIQNLSWLPAGGIVPNPAELLSQGRLPLLIEEALKSFDRVVIDTAPVHPVSDTLLIARFVQTTVLVIHGCKTPRRAAGRALQQLVAADGHPAGVILNLMPRRSGRDYSYSDYYGYGHYGRDNGKVKKDGAASVATRT